MSVVSNFLAADGVAQGVAVVVDGVEGAELNVSASSIHRLYVNRNPYSAQFRTAGKARVEVQTERGSRRLFHGTASLFARASALGARNAFAATKPDLVRLMTDAAIGGPLHARGYSFFFSGSHLMNDDSVVVNARLPNGPVVENVRTPERRTNLFAGFDWRRRSEFSLRYSLHDEIERNRGVGRFHLADQAFTSSDREHQLAIGHHIVFSNTFINDARVTVSHDQSVEGALPRAPQIVVPGAFTSGPSTRFDESENASITLQDTGVLLRGAHTILFGVTVRPKVITATDGSNSGGTFEFSDLEHYRRADPFLFRVNQGRSTVSFGNHTASGFVEDAIHVRPDLSVTAGIRDDALSRVARRHNIAPRLAVAFAPGARKTVVRAGAGLFYDHLPQSAITRSELFDGVRTMQLVIAHPPYPNPFSVADGGRVPPSVTRLDADLVSPQTGQAGVSVERQLWRRTVLTVDYQWFRTTHGLRSRNVNAPLAVGGSRPDPAFLNVDQIESSGIRRGQAMNITLNGRVAHVKTIARYTLSKVTDDGSSAFSLPADNYDLARELGRAEFDRRHRFSLMGVREWQDGAWHLAPVLVVTSGAPYDITTGFDDNGDTVANDRPVGVGRNTGRGPSFAQLDLRVTRVLRAAGPLNRGDRQPQTLELKLDLFNVSNRTNFETFVGVQTSSFFGRANAAKQARTVQLSATYRF